MGEALLKIADGCHTEAVSAHDAAKAANCWTKDATLNVPGMPPAVGPDAIKAMMEMFWAAAPDLKATTGLALIKGNSIASVRTLVGTQTGPFMGAPPSGKKFGLEALALDELTPQGKFASGVHFFDAPTMMAQLGLAKQPSRPVIEAGPERRIIAATDSQTETDNMARLKAGHESFNKRDWKALLADFTDESVISDMGMPKDVKGKKEIEKMFKMFTGAFSDIKINDISVWAAGDYVVSRFTLTGTNDGDLKMMKLKKTGKAVNLDGAEIAEFKDGKVKQLTWYSNGAQMAMQLGLMPPPGSAPPAEGAAKGKKK
jgi:predicted ester cyclase